jgi:metallo-beta-lactamase family protein
VKLAFLGAATTVTGSQFLLTTERARVLVDCGMFQGSPRDSERNRLDFAHDPAAIDAVLLTHAHLDHSGLIPVLVRAGFRGPIHATPPTIQLTRLILLTAERSRPSRPRTIANGWSAGASGSALERGSIPEGAAG